MTRRPAEIVVLESVLLLLRLFPARWQTGMLSRTDAPLAPPWLPASAAPLPPRPPLLVLPSRLEPPPAAAAALLPPLLLPAAVPGLLGDLRARPAVVALPAAAPPALLLPLQPTDTQPAVAMSAWRHTSHDRWCGESSRLAGNGTDGSANEPDRG